ncbi:MAG: hypothetical protein AAGH83_03860 [Pseudomonadota bacterium]
MPRLSDRTAAAALAALIVLQAVMLAALLTRTAPHPPLTVAPFAIAPFLGAALAVAAAALVLGPTRTRTGRALSLAAAAAALVSFGPQKYLDAQFALIWPSVICGQLAAAALIHAALSPHLPDRPTG